MRTPKGFKIKNNKNYIVNAGDKVRSIIQDHEWEDADGTIGMSVKQMNNKPKWLVAVRIK